MKAYQIDPALQESPLFYCGTPEFPGEIALIGNRNFQEVVPAFFAHLKEVFDDEDLAFDIDTIDQDSDFDSEHDAVRFYISPHKRPDFTDSELDQLADISLDWCSADDKTQTDLLCRALAIVTGEKWEFRTLRGCSQGDWQDCYFPVAAWSAEALKSFEIELFNSGSEWVVDDMIVYCHDWDLEEIRDEIANAACADPGDIELYVFDGYDKTPRYRLS